jgi:hypothetical protein
VVRSKRRDWPSPFITNGVGPVARKAVRRSSRKRRERATRLVPIDAAKVFDPGGALAATYQEAVAAAIPASAKIPEMFWVELHARITLFLQLHEKRLHAPRSRQYWERLAWQVEDLASALRRLRRTTLWDRAITPWPSQALAGLRGVKIQCDVRLSYYQTKAETFPRGRDVHREYLYRSVFDLWEDLGQQIRYSSGGPLPRFFRACLEPLVGELPDETIRSVIRHQRALLRKFHSPSEISFPLGVKRP